MLFLSGAGVWHSQTRNKIRWFLAREETLAWLPGGNLYLFALETPLSVDPWTSCKTFNSKLVSDKTHCLLCRATSVEIMALLLPRLYHLRSKDSIKNTHTYFSFSESI